VAAINAPHSFSFVIISFSFWSRVDVGRDQAGYPSCFDCTLNICILYNTSCTIPSLRKCCHRVLFLLVGWRPRRTIVFCSWGAEEYGLVGSTEWVEVTSNCVSVSEHTEYILRPTLQFMFRWHIYFIVLLHCTALLAVACSSVNYKSIGISSSSC